MKICDIKVGDRFRKVYPSNEELKKSIIEYGLIQPIVVDNNNMLVAGERRLIACRELGWDIIDTVLRSDIDPLTAREIELEENLHRADFTDEEKVDAISKIHELKIAKYGEAGQGGKSGWTITDTANALGFGKSKIHMYLQIAEARNEGSEAVTKALRSKGVVAASKQLAYEKEQAIRKFLTERQEQRAKTQPSDETALFEYINQRLIHADCLEWLPSLPSEFADLVLSDPPYGAGLDKANMWGKFTGDIHFDDSEATFMDLLPAVIKQSYRILKPEGYIALWVSFPMFGKVRDWLLEAGFSSPNQPLMWVKMQSAFSAAQLDQMFGSGVEFLTYGWKGKPHLNQKGRPNFTFEPPTRQTDKLHPFDKPVSVLSYFIHNIVLPGGTVVDPFAGSGTTPRAAIARKCEWLACEKDDNYYNTAKAAILEVLKDASTKSAT